jgi:hypothetical protein
MFTVGYSILYDDLAEARRSLAKLAAIDCQTIAFSHGSALNKAGVVKFKQKWASI